MLRHREDREGLEFRICEQHPNQVELLLELGAANLASGGLRKPDSTISRIAVLCLWLVLESYNIRILVI